MAKYFWGETNLEMSGLITYKSCYDLVMKSSKNCQDYFWHWRNTLHQNCHCNNICNCALNTIQLLQSRLDAISRGMPDLSIHIEEEIYEIAWPIHSRKGHRAGVMTVPWALDNENREICDCFFLAKNIRDEEQNKKLILQAPIRITSEDMWYESRPEW